VADGRQDPPPLVEDVSVWTGPRPSGLIGRPSDRPTVLYHLARGGFGVLRRLVFDFRLELEGAEHLPRSADGRPAGGYIAVGLPHRTWVEPLVALELMPATPRLVFYGDGRAMFRSRLRRLFVTRMGGVIPIWKPGSTADRPGEDPIETYLVATRQAIDAGAVVLIFAETGPPVPAGQARPLARGAILLAHRTGVPIVPLVFGGSHALFRGCRIVMRVLPPVSVAELARSFAATAPSGPVDAPEPWSREERALTRAATAALHERCALDVRETHLATQPPSGAKRRWLWLTHLWR
jgi:1-acyl-sn-glycerol-3-phosphate acyltransferase